MPSGIASSTKPELAGNQFVQSNVTLAERFKAVVKAIKWIYDGQWPGRKIEFRGDTT